MKRKPPTPRTPKKPAIDPAVESQLVLLLIQGLPLPLIRQTATTKLGIPETSLDAVLHECRRKITLAADYNRDEELGRAITRLNECYTQSAAIQDVKTCLSAQKELNKLLRLYEARPVRDHDHDESPAGHDDTDTRRHLLALVPNGDKLPTHELARRVALQIVNG